MRYQLDLTVKPAEGALVRVIGMVERRGFLPRTVQAAFDADGRWQLTMDVEGQRPAPILQHQLDKMYDCESVRIRQLPAPHTATP